MNLRPARAVRLLLLMVVATPPVVLPAQLSPLVNTQLQAVGNVPSECDEGQATTPPPRRVLPEEKAIVRDTSADMKAPPTASLRAELQSALEAAQRGARDAFRDSLARAKNLLTDYPPGAERTAANDVVAVFDDLDRLWDYEFNTPTGGFFDAGSDVFRIVGKYPGYDAYIRRQVITDRNGVRFYPSRESRDFLVGEAATRMARLTGRPAPPRPTIRETPVPPRVTTQPPPVIQHVKPTQAKPPKRAPTTTTTHVAPPKPKPKPRPVQPPPTTTHATKTEALAHTAPSKPKPHPVQPPPTTTHVTETEALTPPSPPIVTTTTAATASTTTTPPTTTSVASTTTGQPTTTTAETSTAVADTAVPPPPPAKPAQTPTRGRSIFVPILLIVVGLGVLVMLFRASA